MNDDVYNMMHDWDLFRRIQLNLIEHIQKAQQLYDKSTVQKNIF